ncbi:MAG: type III restriction-modification system endonuclease [Gallionellaceae bacterium]|jgi:type III restriction enzyme
MAGFHFERDLPHQTAAVDAVMHALRDIDCGKSPDAYQNTLIRFSDCVSQLHRNIMSVQENNVIKPAKTRKDLSELKTDNLIFDISMETGTGKTYAYAKTIFELNKQLGLNKFIVAVPRVAIKAGAVSFLMSAAAKEHFKLDYAGRELKVYEVLSQKAGKAKKSRMPQAVMDFCRADNAKELHVLVINSGMINSPTMVNVVDTTLFDKYNTAVAAIAATRPVLIIDEPHLFKTDNKTFLNLARFKPQFTLRYGATFDGKFENLLYQLNAVAAFNQDLVKGIVAHIETFNDGENTRVKLTGLDTQATFELTHNDKKTTFKLSKSASLETVHPEMRSLEVVAFNKTTLVLSNGLELRKGDSINPYSFSDTLQNKMIQQTIVRHFELERELLTQSPRIKPLTLFFIDNIPSYRNKEGEMRVFFEKAIKAHIEQLLKTENDAEYRAHLEVALQDVSVLHGGYFSVDNADSDEAVEKETIEILHDKELLLSIANPRRFIFSKWTLREGWDNPNIFQICKLRTSGSETSKLQEVGRGLRLPVNEYMSRVKDQAHALHYYVDFSEQDFITKLTNEINRKSGVDFNPQILDAVTIAAILNKYAEDIDDEEALLEVLDTAGIINRKNEFKAGGFDKLKTLYPEVFKGVKDGKITTTGKAKSKTSIRLGQYDELKALWESISQKAVLEYQFEGEQDFKRLFKNYLLAHQAQFVEAGSSTSQQRLIVDKDKATYRVEQNISAYILPFRMMSYKAFVTTLSKDIYLSINTLHTVFSELLNEGKLDINHYMSASTIRAIKSGFKDYLMSQVFGQFQINYKKTTNRIHPTVFTSADGHVQASIDASNVGQLHADGKSPNNYLYDDIFYDSELELENINAHIKEVTVYAKIPKNSIRIPLVGGGTYSPDFAYVIKDTQGVSALNLIVETKDKREIVLSEEENKKISHAEKFFSGLAQGITVKFVKQLTGKSMVDVIKVALRS